MPYPARRRGRADDLISKAEARGKVVLICRSVGAMIWIGKRQCSVQVWKSGDFAGERGRALGSKMLNRS